MQVALPRQAQTIAGQQSRASHARRSAAEIIERLLVAAGREYAGDHLEAATKDPPKPALLRQIKRHHLDPHPRDLGAWEAEGHDASNRTNRKTRWMKECRIAVRLVARASRNQLGGIRDGVLQARVTVPPIDGEANKALCRMIAKRLGIAPSKVKVVRGGKSRQKVVGVESLDLATLERVLRERDR